MSGELAGSDRRAPSWVRRVLGSQGIIPEMSLTGPSPILRFFDFEHLPAELQDVSRPFAIMARGLEESLPAGAEKSTALRKLLEAKDAAVRAALPE